MTYEDAKRIVQGLKIILRYIIAGVVVGMAWYSLAVLGCSVYPRAECQQWGIED